MDNIFVQKRSFTKFRKFNGGLNPLAILLLVRR